MAPCRKAVVDSLARLDLPHAAAAGSPRSGGDGGGSSSSSDSDSGSDTDGERMVA